MPDQSDQAHGRMACPSCQAPQDIAPVTVVNPATNELGLLFRGELNKVACPSCGAEFLMEVPMLFRDDHNRFLIYFLPLENPRQYTGAEAQMQAITGQIFNADDDLEPPQCRLTLSRRQFIEKIAIHLNSLDDRLIEYLKYQLYNQAEHPIDSIRSELLYDFSNQDPDKLAFIIFDRESGQPTAATHVDMDIYLELKDDLFTNPDLSAALDKLFPGYYVSVERAI